MDKPKKRSINNKALQVSSNIVLKLKKNGEIAMTEQLREGQRSKWLPGVQDSPAERVHGHQIFISLWLLCEIDPADP